MSIISDISDRRLLSVYGKAKVRTRLSFSRVILGLLITELYDDLPERDRLRRLQYYLVAGGTMKKILEIIRQNKWGYALVAETL